MTSPPPLSITLNLKLIMYKVIDELQNDKKKPVLQLEFVYDFSFSNNQWEVRVKNFHFMK